MIWYRVNIGKIHFGVGVEDFLIRKVGPAGLRWIKPGSDTWELYTLRKAIITRIKTVKTVRNRCLICMVKSQKICAECGKISGCPDHFEGKIRRRRGRVKKSIKFWYEKPIHGGWGSKRHPTKVEPSSSPLCYRCYQNYLDDVLKRNKKR